MESGTLSALGPVVLGHEEDNVLYEQLQTSLMARMIDLGWPHHELTETMRMTRGLLEVPNKLFYANKLKYGPGTDLEERARSQLFS